MKRFVIRNYGPTRQFPYKDKHIFIANDCAIETDDEEEVGALSGQESVHVTDRGSELVPPSSPIKKPEAPEEIAYEDMKVKELQMLAKDREMDVSGLKKAELIAALQAYDAEPDEPDEPEEPAE